MSTTCERYVSLPVFSTSMVMAPSPLTEPPTASSPSVFSTGSTSPVSMDSSTLVRPSTITPSMGTLSPGRTRTRSPFRMSVTDTSSVSPFSVTREAVSGISLTRASSAPDAPMTDRISIQWPSSMTSIRVASSQKKTRPSTPKTTADE